jgi:hypothetical protein
LLAGGGMNKTLSVLLWLAACTGSNPPQGDDSLVDIAGFSSEQRPLDLLLVIDDSAGMAAKQRALAANLPALIAQLGGASDGLPDLHIGVISTDMGTSSTTSVPATAIGQPGAGGCMATGKAGKLLVQPAAAGAMTARYLAVPRTGAPNFTGTLAEVLGEQVLLGETGCGFEQPLAAIRAALHDPDNAGFLRDEANLAVIVVSDEDDCSARAATLFGPDSSSLGTLDSFRCFRFGVTCAPDDPMQLGPKTGCAPREDSTLVDDVAGYRDELLAVKDGDARRVMFATLAGPTSTVAVELRPHPAGGSRIALAHGCAFGSPSGQLTADPPVRLTALVGAFGINGSAQSICSEDLASAEAELGAAARRLAGDRCLARAVPFGAACTVFEAPEATPAQRTELPACAAVGDTAPCYRVVEDAACSAGQRLDIVRATAAAPGTWTSMQCRL